MGELSLVAYSAGGELLVFAERSELSLERAVCVFSRFNDAALAVSLCALRPRASSLLFCEGRWYIELHDTRDRLEDLVGLLCEFGSKSDASAMWLREHGRVVVAQAAFETLPALV